jgi:small subunit ribosomal protein S8
MSDPIANMLTAIRNGFLVKAKNVTVPYSRIKKAIAKILTEENFLAGFEIEGKKPVEKKLVLALAYRQKKPAVTRIKRVSRPGCRIYAKAGKVVPVRQGFGVTVVSTSQGLMTDKQANKKNLGGEVLFQVWR